jgi:positive regulator of sigma E activity
MKSELENTMLKPAILVLIRQILTIAGTALVAKGYFQASDFEAVIGALLTIGSVVGSVADKRGLHLIK